MNNDKTNKILMLVNDSKVRLRLFKEIEELAEIKYAIQFTDIIAEIKWGELDTVVIDADDEYNDTAGIVQILNTACPTVGLVLFARARNEVLDQLVDILP